MSIQAEGPAKRVRLRVRIRTLMLAVFIGALVLAFGMQYHRERRLRARIQQLEAQLRQQELTLAYDLLLRARVARQVRSEALLRPTAAPRTEQLRVSGSSSTASSGRTSP